MPHFDASTKCGPLENEWAGSTRLPFLNIFTRKLSEPNYRASVVLALLAYTFLKLRLKN